MKKQNKFKKYSATSRNKKGTVIFRTPNHPCASCGGKKKIEQSLNSIFSARNNRG